MLPELYNTRIQYPFLQSEDSDSKIESFEQSIKDIRIFCYSDQPVQAFVTSFSPSQIICQLVKEKSLQTFTVRIYNSGVFQGDIDRRNSFIQFSSPVTVQGIGRLQLLPQTVVCIPTELRLSISSRGIKAKAQPGQPQYTSSDSLRADMLIEPHFIPGYNFVPFVDEQAGAVTFSAGAGMGVGSPGAGYLRRRIADCTHTVYHQDAYYYGIRTINGQSGDIQIQVSQSMYTKATADNGVLNIAIQRIKNNVQTT